MATPAVDSSSDHFLQLSSLPVVDLRLFSQSELTSLSLCSDPSFDFRRSDDVVDPKIDRSIFNESAGSRKQTYSRLRLARRPSDSSSAPGPRRRRPPGLLPDDDAAERRSNDHIVFFLRKLFAPSGDGIPEPTPPPSAGTRKANSDRSFAVYDNGSEIVNRNGAVVDVPVATGRCEDPFAAEVRRRTEGLRTKEELIGFLEGFEGQWGSNRRKKRFVDAGVFGDVLPKGWRIMLSLKRRGGRAWLICRKYISPNGQQFESFKEVSSYSLSLFGPEGSSLERSAHIDKSSQLPTQSTAGLTFKDDIAKDAPVSYSVIPISSSAPMFSVSTKHENQVVLFNAENQGADKSSSASQKHEKVSDFEELRLDDIETTKFDFVTGQDSESLSDTPMDLTYMVDFEQGLDNSIQFEWDSVLPKMVGGNQFTGVCGWCRVEFNLGNANPEMYPDSVFVICPNCKAKSAGQFNALDNGFSMNSDQL